MLDRFEYGGDERETIETRWRSKSVPIEHDVHGTAVIRDQGPMPPRALRRVLDGMSPCEWYRLINGKAFLWATRKRLLTFLDAKAYRNAPHIVLRVDTRELLRRHADRVSLAHFNTGSVSQWGTPRRGAYTFQRISNYPAPKVVAEVAVYYHIPDIAEFTLTVDEWQGIENQREVWRP